MLGDAWVIMLQKMRKGGQSLATSTYNPFCMGRESLLLLKSFMLHMEVSRSQENGFVNS